MQAKHVVPKIIKIRQQLGFVNLFPSRHSIYLKKRVNLHEASLEYDGLNWPDSQTLEPVYTGER